MTNLPSTKVERIFPYFDHIAINPFAAQLVPYKDGEFVEEKRTDTAMRIADIFTHVYHFGDQQRGSLYRAISECLARKGKSTTMLDLKATLEKEKASTVVSKASQFFDSDIFEPRDGFTWKDILYPEHQKITIFDLTSFATTEMKVLITEFLLWSIWGFVSIDGRQDKPFIAVMDEAQNLPLGDGSASMKILKEGRKFGWSAWYATQILNGLPDNAVDALNMAENKLYFRPSDTDMLTTAKIIDHSNLNFNSQGYLQRLSKGHCLFSSHINDGKSVNKPVLLRVASFDERKKED